MRFKVHKVNQTGDTARSFLLFSCKAVNSFLALIPDIVWKQSYFLKILFNPYFIKNVVKLIFCPPRLCCKASFYVYTRKNRLEDIYLLLSAGLVYEIKWLICELCPILMKNRWFFEQLRNCQISAFEPFAMDNS